MKHIPFPTQEIPKANPLQRDGLFPVARDGVQPRNLGEQHFTSARKRLVYWRIEVKHTHSKENCIPSFKSSVGG